MKRLRAVSLTVLSLTGCSDEVWYRAVARNGGWVIARADIANDSCAIMVVGGSSPAGNATPVTGIEVKLRDAEFAHVASVWDGTRWDGQATSAADCTTNNFGEGLLGTEGSGSIRFREVSFIEGRQVACKVKLSAEISGVKFHETVDILDEDCTPPSGGEKRKYHAPKAQFSGTGLSITAWDAKSNTCASLGFEVNANEVMQQIAMPEHWTYRSGHLTYMKDAENCNPTGTFNGGFDQPRLDVSSSEETDSGRLRFEASEASEVDGMPLEIPCRLSVNVSVELPQEYYWVPRFMTIEGTGVTVGGACD